MDGELYFYVDYGATVLNDTGVNTRISSLFSTAAVAVSKGKERESSEISFKFFYSCTESWWKPVSQQKPLCFVL